MQAESRRAGQRLYGCRSEACLPPLVGFWLALEAGPAVGFVAGAEVSRGPVFDLVPVLRALLYRAKSRAPRIAGRVGIYRLDDRSAPVRLAKPVRRWNADRDRKSRLQTRSERMNGRD